MIKSVRLPKVFKFNPPNAFNAPGFESNCAIGIAEAIAELFGFGEEVGDEVLVLLLLTGDVDEVWFPLDEVLLLASWRLAFWSSTLRDKRNLFFFLDCWLELLFFFFFLINWIILDNLG